MSVWDELRYFKRREFDHPDKMDDEFLLELDSLRDLAGFPIIVTSDHRPGATVAPGGHPSAHSEVPCRAVDCAPMGGMSGRARFLFVRAALAVGFERIGVYDHHFHVDLGRGAHLPHRVMWIGESS